MFPIGQVILFYHKRVGVYLKFYLCNSHSFHFKHIKFTGEVWQAKKYNCNNRNIVNH